jgi:very-short-patch-repair endonuclease
MHSGKMYGGKLGTKPEQKMKQLLIDYGVSYLFQERIGSYLVDFFLPLKKLIIEVDGEYWHNYPKGKDSDKVRDIELKKLGYTVKRFWANDVFKMKTISL